MTTPLEDYALIGNCHTAALLSRSGSLDWLCLPSFSSPACFAALLGNPTHGRWLLTAKEPYELNRRYVKNTMVLETLHRTEKGLCRIRDCMLVGNEPEVPVIVRLVEGLSGVVSLRMELIIRFDYGAIVPWVRRIEDDLVAVGGPDTLRLHTPVPLHGEGLTTLSEFTVQAGETIPLVLTWHLSYQPRPTPVADPVAAVKATEAWWENWASICRCDRAGATREAVLRSLLTLKALSYKPTGGIVAAPTTSLPEKIGGSRNWDYRYCWLRDSTFTLYALLSAGYREEATRWREWLVRALAGTPEQVNIMYGLAGERRLAELELPWLPGYEDSRPVRTGNAAHGQQQNDVFGEVIDTLHLARRYGLSSDEDAWRVECKMMEHLSRVWAEPDEGIWEVRGPRRHFTHSKVMAWVAFDRMLAAIREFGLPGPESEWAATRARIFTEVCERGYNRELGHFVQSYDSREVDASLLMLGLVGFLPPEDERYIRTVFAIEKELLHDGLLLRYRSAESVDGLPPGEGAFLACSFWLADSYALLGRMADAERLFARLLAMRNDVGLLSEEFDFERKRLVGNFPQAFSHIALVNTAFNLSLIGKRKPAADRSQQHVPQTENDSNLIVHP